MNFLHHYDPNNPYPESDGLPMAENTEQYDWLVKIKENLEILFADREDVFIAADLLWYPVSDRRLSYPMAPDVMVAFGRPKGRRGSYMQWEEDGVAPQVVFEILSPSNSVPEMKVKKDFYDKYGVQEYYVYDPAFNRLEIWTRQDKHLKKMSHIHGWTSPLLEIRFALNKQTLHIFYPSGKPFLNSVELSQYAQEAEQRAKVAIQHAEVEAKARQQAEKRADIEAKNRQQAEQLAKVEAKNRQQAEQRADIEAKNRQQAEQRADIEAKNRQQAEQLAKVEAKNRQQAEQRADIEAKNRQQAEQRADIEAKNRQQAEQRAARLAEQLRALGFNPDTE